MSLNATRHFPVIFYFLMGLIVGPFFYTVGPIVERELMPVVTSTEITEIVNFGETIQFYGKSDKVRDCPFDHVDWFLGDPDKGSVRLTLNMKEGTKIRNEGGFDFGPWEVYLNEEQLRYNSYAITYHRCHPLWLSQSKFFP